MASNMKDTSGDAGPKILDPVCDMIVAIDEAREDGRTLELDARPGSAAGGPIVFAFCSPGCLQTFAKAPHRFRSKVDAWLAANPSQS
jgi:YHS domain-containing protein